VGTQIFDGGPYGYHSAYHHSGSWDDQGVPSDQEWFLISTYIDNAGFLIKSVGFMRLDGSDVRFLAHTFGVGTDYWETPRATISVDGKLVMFDSDFGGATGGDVYVVEVPLAVPEPFGSALLLAAIAWHCSRRRLGAATGPSHGSRCCPGYWELRPLGSDS
jgi:hypothetical protein